MIIGRYYLEKLRYHHLWQYKSTELLSVMTIHLICEINLNKQTVNV